MSTIETLPIIQEVVNLFIRNVGDNLFALISVGSLTTKHYLESWSDIDLIVVFETISLTDKDKIAKLKLDLERTYKKKFGINIITKQEATSPILPATSLDGKTLQGLLDLGLHPERILFCKNKAVNFFVPDIQTVKEYSISNIFMFVRRNRKSLTSELAAGDIDLKKITEREIRASFIMTKLAIQYVKGFNCSGYKEIAQIARELFPNYDSSILFSLESAINQWDEIDSKDNLSKLLKDADAYIESFSEYILGSI